MESIVNTTNIVTEGEKIYPISKDSDKKCSELNPFQNLTELFYHIKSNKIKERFIILTSKGEYKNFFQGLNYEYGINNIQKNLSKAFSIYKKAADETTDTMSMYRLYKIYKTDYTKFEIKNRNRIFEKYYLFKCFTYLPYQILIGNKKLCNKFDIRKELQIQFNIEEKDNLEKFHLFIQYLKNHSKELKINIDDINLIEGVIEFSFGKKSNSKNIAIPIILGLTLKQNLEAIYKLACFEIEVSKTISEKYFTILKNEKYYRSFADYILFSYSEKNYKEFLSLAKTAYCKSYYDCGPLYLNIYLQNNSIDDLMNEAIKIASSKNNTKSDLTILINILLSEITLGSVCEIYNLIIFRKICVKHYGLLDYFNDFFLDESKEIYDYIIKIIDGSDEEIKKKLIKYYNTDSCFSILNLNAAIILYYGMENYYPKNLEMSFKKIRLAFNKENSYDYNICCQNFLYKICQKIFNQQKSKNSVITEEKMKEIKNNLFQLNYSLLSNDNTDKINLNSSYFYFMSRLYHKKIGNNGDELMEYIFLKGAAENNNFKLSNYSSLNDYYRKSKAVKLIRKIIDDKKYLDVIKNTKGFNNENDSITCSICYERKNKIICIPCKHLFCEFCIKEIKKAKKCPICRSIIIFTIKIFED